jgi:hypothetical protein
MFKPTSFIDACKMAGVILIIYILMLLCGTSSFYKIMLAEAGLLAFGAGYMLSIARKCDSRAGSHISNGFAWISAGHLVFAITGSMYEAFGLINEIMITLTFIAVFMIARSDNWCTRMLNKKAEPALEIIEILWGHASKTKLIRLLRLIVELVSLYSQGRPFPGDGVTYYSVPIGEDGTPIGRGTPTTWCFCDEPKFHQQ